jgi:hypothetical protein
LTIIAFIVVIMSFPLIRRRRERVARLKGNEGQTIESTT